MPFIIITYIAGFWLSLAYQISSLPAARLHSHFRWRDKPFWFLNSNTIIRGEPTAQVRLNNFHLNSLRMKACFFLVTSDEKSFVLHVCSSHKQWHTSNIQWQRAPKGAAVDVETNSCFLAVHCRNIKSLLCSNSLSSILTASVMRFMIKMKQIKK